MFWRCERSYHAALGYYLDNLAVLDPMSTAGYRLEVPALPDACRLATRPGRNWRAGVSSARSG